MVVLKFGGTSVGTPENIRRVKDIIKSKLTSNDKVIIVVSALGGITDSLLSAGQKAANGDSEYEYILKNIEERHINVVRELFPPSNQSSTISQIKLHLNQLEDICKGIFWIKEFTVKTKDYLLSFGELMSSILISNYFNAEGIKCSLEDPKSFIKTDSNHGNANVDFEQTNKFIREHFNKQDSLCLCPGFIASDKHDETTTLGRGGSDFTASILAAALEASQLEIWTDVDGMMTADPRFVTSASSIDTITYEDAMELSHFGAKVIYPPTIQPVLEREISIIIKNTLNTDFPGTFISSKDESAQLIKGLSCIQNIALLNLKGSGMVGIPNFSNRLFKALSFEKVNVILITQASSEHSICVGVDESDAERSRKAVEKEFDLALNMHKIDPVEVETGLSIIALVGSNMKQQVGVSGKLFGTLGDNGINVKAIAQGSSERNISIVIEKRNVKKALSSLHESFFLSERKRINLFIIGVGNVGGTFLNQLLQQSEYLQDKHHLDIRVVALANSRKMIFNEEGIDLSKWKEKLEKANLSFDASSFLHHMTELNLRNSVFIDNTDSNDIADLYEEVLGESISVVTPNKVACSSEYQRYVNLKKIALKNKGKFLFETNVGAGLPIISTINDLIKSGDTVERIEAVLSGSLNFIFNNYDGKIPFVEVVKLAMKEGYTEPDPRIDLSGIDVMRKILILIRESGYVCNLDDVESKPFIKEEIMSAPDVESFLQKLEENEKDFSELLTEATEKGCRLKYVATYNQGRASAGLQFIKPDHPFYNLEGKDNIVLLYTGRYTDQPLVIKGAGAGAEVTASGIFADVLRFAHK